MSVTGGYHTSSSKSYILLVVILAHVADFALIYSHCDIVFQYDKRWGKDEPTQNTNKFCFNGVIVCRSKENLDQSSINIFCCSE